MGCPRTVSFVMLTLYSIPVLRTSSSLSIPPRTTTLSPRTVAAICDTGSGSGSRSLSRNCLVSGSNTRTALVASAVFPVVVPPIMRILPRTNTAQWWHIGRGIIIGACRVHVSGAVSSISYIVFST